MAENVLTPRRAQRPGAKARQGDAREAALLSAAEKMLGSGEFGDASIQQIADAAGISRPSFYFYFGSKQALLAHLIERTLQTLAGRVSDEAGAEAGADDIHPVDQLKGAIAAAAEIWRAHGDVMCAAVELSASVPEIDRRWKENVEATTQTGVELLMAHGTVPEARDEADARRLVRVLIWATERNFYNLMRSGPSNREIDELKRELATIWQRALGISR